MAAEMKVIEWAVEGVDSGNISIRREDDGTDYVKIMQGEESVWLGPDDVPALIDALQAAAN